MSKKAFIRNQNGEPVVLQELQGEVVAVSVGGQDRKMKTSDWQALPLWPAGVSLEEARTIHEIVRRAVGQYGFRRYDLRFGEDATADPAVWISFSIGPPFPKTTEETHPLTEAASAVKAALFAEGIDRIPYVGFHEQREGDRVKLGTS